MVGQSHTTTFLLFTTFLFISRSISAVDLSPRPNTTITNDLDFIRTSCNATLYPDMCFTSLARYASAVKKNPASLAKHAIWVSLSQTKSLADFLSKLSRSVAANDPDSDSIQVCVENVEDAVDQMRASIQQLCHMKSESVEKFRFKVSNLLTWMSASSTDEETCTDAFEETEEAGSSGSVIQTKVCDRVGKVKMFTSNALNLVNSYAKMNGAADP